MMFMACFLMFCAVPFDGGEFPRTFCYALNEVENLLTLSMPVTPKLSQISVLNQMHDGSGSGFENCGYHALKNAICLLTALGGGDTASFEDKQFFEVFYQNYGRPLVEHLKPGYKDASTPLLRQIFRSFMADPFPHHLLQPSQAIWRNMPADRFAVFSAFPTLKNENLEFRLFDRAGFKDALKLVRFAEAKGPGLLICLVANVLDGHWFTIALIKSLDDSLSFFGCDSMQNNQRGESCPLAKMSTLFDCVLQDIKNFNERALCLFLEEFAHYGDWLDTRGVPLEEKSRFLLIELAGRPAKLFVSCLLAAKSILKQSWPSSLDTTKLLQVQRIISLLRFYAESLPETSAESIKARLLLELFN